MATATVFIDGDQGTTGLQIHARLRERDDIRLLTLPDDARKDPQRRRQAFQNSDIAILCLPDDASRQAMALIGEAGTRVIDASSAHRTDPAWVYGFPEMAQGQAAAIAQARLVTNPGCYPTGAIGLLRPLVQAGLLAPDYPLAIHAVSGYSGGGRAAVERHEDQAAGHAADFLVYGLGLMHKHVPEIQAHGLLSQRPAFVPAYGAFRQGIVLTIALQQRLLPAGVDAAALHAALVRHYADAREVTVLSRQDAAALAQLDPQACNGTNGMQLAVFDNGALGQILLTAVFDNLGKGAAGAAVQNLDLMLG